MKLKSLWMRAVSLFIALLLAVPLPVTAQQDQQPQQGQAPQKKLSKEELSQLLAPIALYPDELVAQILMASTYPLEVVEADRWAQKNKNLKGDDLTKALEKEDWDPSVKSMVNFPSVLSSMSQKLDVTSKIGDAFLEQQKDVMDTIQDLRKKAQSAGNLKTNKQQQVVVEQNTIVIKPADPQVVYVPSYNPTVVYGTWAYPAYPPYYYYPPPPAYYPGLTFAAGVTIGLAWGYAWGSCNWHGGSVNYNVNRNVNINNNINRTRYQNRQGTWQHDAAHRRGVAYRDGATARRYGQSPAQSAANRREARGYGGTRAGGAGAGTRPAAGTTARAGGTSGAARESAFSGGAGSGRQERMASDRGHASRQSAGMSRGGGGGFRGGGGRRR
ncbi:DUF3300 domain-containing protein [Geobacter sp. SVR]|uniref:DUF3300 domain-containing protein n=1 Tax=Geobacter sp. SVR TaxID=2495594 RepID=UPI00143EFFDA|nr:DUF3300 domain-containing protein [Geobacter sp. SVR]BCS52875.1 hypothetical protein GSVR_11830 [Geobacter sp. SVR]GCF87498.1 hypothetical protein GSbR_40980 [Geobacter sp. SVR]